MNEAVGVVIVDVDVVLAHHVAGQFELVTIDSICCLREII